MLTYIGSIILRPPALVPTYHPTHYTVGWSEKPKSWKSKNVQADYLPRHSPDVRTVFEIKIRPLVFCEIGQMRFTEKGINFKKPRRRHFTEKSPNFMKPSQI